MEKTNKTLVIGVWKFKDRLGKDELMKLGNEWAQDDKYTLVYVTHAGKEQLGLGFAYAVEGTKEASDDYYDRTSDALKRRFGNDFIGWDMATTQNLIKGF